MAGVSPRTQLTVNTRGSTLEQTRRSQFLLFSTPAIGQEEMDEVADTLRSGWITTGPKTRLFETTFRDFVGAADAELSGSELGGFDLREQARDLLRVRPINVLMFKVSYWLNP